MNSVNVNWIQSALSAYVLAVHLDGRVRWDLSMNAFFILLWDGVVRGVLLEGSLTPVNSGVYGSLTTIEGIYKHLFQAKSSEKHF